MLGRKLLDIVKEFSKHSEAFSSYTVDYATGGERERERESLLCEETSFFWVKSPGVIQHD